MNAAESGVYETRADIFKSPVEARKYWLNAIRLSGDEENDWRKESKAACDLYEIKTQTAFNILHSNVETTVPAIYNSPPVPDCRTRYNDKNEVARKGAELLERGLSYQLDQYDFSEEIRQVAYDFCIVGRGVAWVTYEPMIQRVAAMIDPETGAEIAPAYEKVIWQQLECERVPWDRFRRGPASSWKKVPWVARLRFMTRDEIGDVADAKIAEQVGLDASQYDVPLDDKSNAEREKSVWKCAGVWEIWDRETRKVFYVAESFELGPIAVLDDPLRLMDFFPCPRPAQVLRKRTSLTPIVPYTTYAAQAKELAQVSQRILALVAMLKWRGVRAAEVPELDGLDALDDGQFVPSKEALTLLQNRGSLENAIWVMPIEKIIEVVRELVGQREAIKQQIFELSGMSDIIRGSTDPRETRGAQEIKAQWGSLRLQNQQAEIQRFCRDLIRIKAELIGEKFEPDVLNMMAGEQVAPEVLAAVKSDRLRSYMIDIETDSTIRADLTRTQQNISQFMDATARYVRSVGPAVKEGMLPPGVAVAIFAAFARTFKLGKQVEGELSKLGESSEQFGAQKQTEIQQVKQIQRQGAQLDQAEKVIDIQKKAAEVQGQRIENASVAAGVPPGPGFVR